MASLLHDSGAKRLSHGTDESTRQAAISASAEISYIDHPDFDCPEFVHNILETLPKGDASHEAGKNGRLKGEDYRLPSRPLLNAESERGLFLRMNLLRRMASRRQQRLTTGRGTQSCQRIIDNLLSDAKDVRNEILEANQRLVVSNAAKFLRSGLLLADLVSEGNLALMKAVDGFDISRGFRLSTYATYAIRRHLSRLAQREQKRALAQSDEPVEPIIENEEAEWLDVHPGRLVNDILGALPAREREIVMMRYGLTKDGKALTLDKIGQHFGISKERVRQLILRSCSEAFQQHADRLGMN